MKFVLRWTAVVALLIGGGGGGGGGVSFAAPIYVETAVVQHSEDSSHHQFPHRHTPTIVHVPPAAHLEAFPPFVTRNKMHIMSNEAKHEESKLWGFETLVSENSSMIDPGMPIQPQWSCLSFLEYARPFQLFEPSHIIPKCPSSCVSLSVDSLIMQGGKQTITVRWRSLPWHWSPYWVGAYLVSDDITRTSPIKFQFVVNSVRGEHKFDMLNMREDIVFYLFKAIGDKAQLVGKSNVVSLERKNQPTQAHLAYTSNPGELLLSWTTGRNFTNQMVQFGPSTSNITAISMASSALLYSSEEMCGGWASGVGFRDPGIRHRAMMKATQGSKDLCYRYGSDDDGWSKIRCISIGRTFPHRQAFSFVVYGDVGQHSNDHTFQHCDCPASKATTASVEREISDISFVLHVGDISYAKGFESEWENFMDQIEEIATQVPYMTAIGNHERDWPNSGSVRGSFDSGGECGVAYNRRFVMPAPSPTLPSFSAFSSSASSDSPWYSFSHPLLHVAVISTEHSLEQQKKWLEEDLRLVDRSVTPWVMVVGHRPMYFTGILPGAADDQQVAQELREAFEPLLMLYKVDVVLAGHHHSYQRTCPIYHGECQKTGDGGYAAPVYLVTGNGGYLNSPIVMPKPKEFEYADSLHHGYLRVSVDEKFLEVQYLRTSRHGQAKTHDKIRLAAHN